jgi:acyl-coenzyme A synthetase/AMP-(fatty) acid ligase
MNDRMNLNPIAALQARANEQPRSVAFHFGGEVWTYGRLCAEINRLALGLEKRGLRKGDIVALHMTNRPELLVAYCACFCLGLIAAPLRTAFTAAELAPMLHRLRPSLYIGDVALYNANVAAISEPILPFAARYVVGGIAGNFRVKNWEKLSDIGPALEVPMVVDVDAPVLLINTSGSTGQPKLVTHTLGTLTRTTELIRDHRGLETTDIFVLQSALAHAGGFTSFLTYVRFGMPFILLKAFDPDVVLDTVEQYRCTQVNGFPANFAMLLDRQLAQPRDLQSLRSCMTVGDVCPIELQMQFGVALGIPLRSAWGATEVVGSITYGIQPGPVCRVVSGEQIRLINDRGEEVPHGEAGELCIRGANVFVGYWGDPGLTAEVLRDGWYRTGDIMRRGDGDDLWFVGRKKDIIIRGGTNISPVEVEAALLSHPAVQDAAVVGVPDAVLGQRVLGFVKLANGFDDEILVEILTATAKQLAAYKVPDRIVIVRELPRNTQSKVDRAALAELALGPLADSSRG